MATAAPIFPWARFDRPLPNPSSYILTALCNSSGLAGNRGFCFVELQKVNFHIEKFNYALKLGKEGEERRWVDLSRGENEGGVHGKNEFVVRLTFSFQ